MTTKHTPGPWNNHGKVIKDSGLPFVPVVATTLIAKVYSTAFGDDEQAIANARIMAAALDLLEALVMVRDADDNCRIDGLQTIPPAARQKIDAAIAKATGVSA